LQNLLGLYFIALMLAQTGLAIAYDAKKDLARSANVALAWPNPA